MEEAESRVRRERPGEGLLRVLRAFEHADPLGAPINVYQHCLQTATRVLAAGGDDELVVVALFHDVTECFSDAHHGELAAQMLGPWLSARRRWLLERHVEFQAHHFANHPRRDLRERERWRGHPFFEETAAFCERFDQCSFDPDHATLALPVFEPIVRRFLAPQRTLSSTGSSPSSSKR